MRGMLPLNEITNGDSIALLNAQPEGWVDLVFADPPFNIGYLYHGYDDQKDVNEYVNWSEQWMRAVHRALKPNGSFYLAIGDEFAADLCHVARRKIGFHMRNWIIWHYTFGQQTKKMFAKSHTHILYFTKSKTDFTFNPDDVRVASADRRPMPTVARIQKASCRMTRGSCARRKRPRTGTSNPTATRGTKAACAARSRNARAGTAARCRSAC